MKFDSNDFDFSYFSLSITQSSCHSDASEWVLNTRFTYHICSIRELFVRFKELDDSLMFMGDDHTC